jgi:hypothetical protein
MMSRRGDDPRFAAILRQAGLPLPTHLGLPDLPFVIALLGIVFGRIRPI